ncbi:MAG: acyltransferase [Chitinophagales bacterium]|nr:acyltransferase [Chitinophagales bacterium]
MSRLANFFSFPATSSRRNFGLDFFRALALSLAIIGHCFNFFQYSYPGIFHWFFLFRDAVEMFFVLSGFLIGNMLFKLSGPDDKITWPFLKDFFKRRWFKTLPAYYVAIGVNLLAGYFLWDTLLQGFSWRFFVFTQNVTRADFYFLPVSYSLSIEEWFYLLLPASLLLLQWIKPTLSISKRILLVAGVFILAFNGIRWYAYATRMPDLAWDMQMRKSIITRLDVSMYGVLAAWCFNLYKTQFFRFKYLAFIAGLTLFGFSLYMRVNYSLSFYTYVLYFSAVPIAFALWLPLLYQLNIKEGFLRRTITYISLTSYSYYLLHLSPILFLMMHFWPAQTVAESFLEVGVFLCFSFACSHVLYTCVEKPIMDLRDKV